MKFRISCFRFRFLIKFHTKWVKVKYAYDKPDTVKSLAVALKLKLGWQRIGAGRYLAFISKAGTRGWSSLNWFELTLVQRILALFKNWFLFLLLHSIAQMTFLSTTLNILSIVININNNLNNNNNNNNRLNINAQSNNNIVTNTNVNNGNQVKFILFMINPKKG